MVANDGPDLPNAPLGLPAILGRPGHHVDHHRLPQPHRVRRNAGAAAILRPVGLDVLHRVEERAARGARPFLIRRAGAAGQPVPEPDGLLARGEHEVRPVYGLAEKLKLLGGPHVGDPAAGADPEHTRGVDALDHADRPLALERDAQALSQPLAVTARVARSAPRATPTTLPATPQRDAIRQEKVLRHLPGSRSDVPHRRLQIDGGHPTAAVQQRAPARVPRCLFDRRVGQTPSTARRDRGGRPDVASGAVASATGSGPGRSWGAGTPGSRQTGATARGRGAAHGWWRRSPSWVLGTSRASAGKAVITRLISPCSLGSSQAVALGRSEAPGAPVRHSRVDLMTPTSAALRLRRRAQARRASSVPVPRPRLPSGPSTRRSEAQLIPASASVFNNRDDETVTHWQKESRFDRAATLRPARNRGLSGRKARLRRIRARLTAPAAAKRKHPRSSGPRASWTSWTSRAAACA